MKVEIVNRVAQVPREQWNALLAHDDSPFLDWDWLAAMEESASAGPKTGWAPHHLLLHGSGRAAPLIAACPLYLKSHSMGEFVFDHGWAQAAERAGLSYYPKLLAAVPFTPHTGRRFLVHPDHQRGEAVTALARAMLSLCQRNELSSVHINFCHPEEIQWLRPLGFVERLGYQYHWINGNFLSFDDYLAALKSKRRYAVRQERAAIVTQGIEIRTFTGDDISDELLAAMFKIYRSTIDKLYWGRQYLTRKFFSLVRDIRRHLCLVCAFEDGELIAGTFNLQKAGVLYGRYWGALRERKFLHFNVCYYAAIEHCIANGMERFEPGAGGDYKWLRGFDPALTHSLHYIAHPGLNRAIGDFLRREREEVKEWIAVGHQHSQLKAPPPSNVEPE